MVKAKKQQKDDMNVSEHITINPEFNLIDEPWIKVLDKKGNIRELSIKEVLINCQDYLELKGEVASQNFPILRLLLAILHTIFTQVDCNGNEKDFDDVCEAIDRWFELWNMKKFPVKPILNYLDKWHDKFWLFHPSFPFYQVNKGSCGELVFPMSEGTEYGANKLCGELSESNNKLRLFSPCFGVEKSELSYSTAARWLLYLNSFDDTSAKSTKHYKDYCERNKLEKQSPGCGWLGKLGLIFASGNNLFETLMLNLTFLTRKNQLWPKDKPVWEEQPVTIERNCITQPDNLAKLYTLQSRRLYLKRNQNKVNGYFLLGGDFFEKENFLLEPMTVFRPIYGKNKKEILGYQPSRHDSSKQFWRNFSSVFVNKEGNCLPGVIIWILYLSSRNINVLPRKSNIRFNIASVQYGDKDFFIDDLFQDSLSFDSKILSDIGYKWQRWIDEEIIGCDKIADSVARFGNELEKASKGDSDYEKGLPASLKSLFYHQIDAPFRKWLSSIDSTIDDELANKKIEEWRDTCLKIARKLVEEIYIKAGDLAFVGKKVDNKHYSSPDAYKWFLINLGKIY